MFNQQIVSALQQGFDTSCQELFQELNETSQINKKIVQTLRASNQIEIKTILTKFKRLFNELLARAIDQISHACNDYFSTQYEQIFKLYAEIERQKKDIVEKDNKITDLIIDNFSLQSSLNLEPQSNMFGTLVDQYNEEIKVLKKQIDEQEQIIQAHRDRESQLQQQILEYDQKLQIVQQQLDEQKRDILIIDQKQEKTEIVDVIQKFHDEEELSSSSSVGCRDYSDLLNNRSNSTELCSKSNPFINPKLKTICREGSEKNTTENNFGKSIKLAPMMKTVDHNICTKQTSFRQSGKDQMIDLQSLLGSIKERRPKKLDNLYLYSRANKRSRSINVDVYYEPPRSYRFNLMKTSCQMNK